MAAECQAESVGRGSPISCSLKLTALARTIPSHPASALLPCRSKSVLCLPLGVKAQISPARHPRCIMTWAAVAQQPARPAQEPDQQAREVAGGTIAVLDASAIISGFSREVAEILTTVPLVIEECRDAVAKQRLQLLPEGINILQPSEESLKRVSAFAKLVGEYHTLSRVDLQLLALTHTAELCKHGERHMRHVPPPPRVAAKRPPGQTQLPGWGSQGTEWAALDALGDSEASAQATGGSTQPDDVSRVSARVEVLNIEDAEITDTQGPDQEDLQASSSSASDHEEEPGAHSTADDGGDWAVAAKSSGAARQQRRKQLRRAAREDAARVTGHTVHGSQQASLQNHLAVDGSGSQQDGDHDDASSQCSDAAHGEEADQGPQAGCVALVTGDYAMQNVALQMGMHLVAPDGARITRIARWALRCSACFKVSLEHGRLFCDRCGNAALDKVEVVVGADGLQQYGVRKKHNLRGTRFTLPKPKGGKTAQPILREDVLLQRMPRARKAQGETPDAFAPEYSQDNWFKQHVSGSSRHASQVEAAASLGHVKRNPNERWRSRSNRRK